ncbi:MAG: GIY-YIG nuclease family protein [Campylobacterota bacterium]|nr:GIY-YIG nuclease family protein [Campylobacterota bacterium]
MNIKDELLKELENDPFNLLVFKPKVSTNRDESKIVIEHFNKILDFYEKNGREPNKDNDRAERTLANILKSIRDDKNQIAVVKELDKFELLDSDDVLVADINLDEINDLDDDPFGLLGDDENDIFTLKHVTKEKDMPDYIARRKPCKDFEKYKSLFQNCHKDIIDNKRKVNEYRSERYLQEGVFFILGGVIGYIENIGETKATNQKTVTNARLKCIFENGTQSDMLLRSLSAGLYKDGKLISQLNEEIESNLSQINNEDELNGYIYILQSKSDDEIIRNINNLFKIGYSTATVDERIKNAKNEPTYLMADVLKVASYQCYNMNTQKFEQLLHQFFGASCLNIKIIGNDNQEHTPREWFIAPLNIIKQAVNLLINGEIIYYRYDDNLMEIVQI